MIEKTMEISRLDDFYSALLTEKQQSMIELYYHQDFSLGEVAEIFQISRQAVYDTLKRTEKILYDYEAKLNLAGLAEEREKNVNTALEKLDALEKDLSQKSDQAVIKEKMAAIKQLLIELV